MVGALDSGSNRLKTLVLIELIFFSKFSDESRDVTSSVMITMVSKKARMTKEL